MPNKYRRAHTHTHIIACWRGMLSACMLRKSSGFSVDVCTTRMQIKWNAWMLNSSHGTFLLPHRNDEWRCEWKTKKKRWFAYVFVSIATQFPLIKAASPLRNYRNKCVHNTVATTTQQHGQKTFFPLEANGKKTSRFVHKCVHGGCNAKKSLGHLMEILLDPSAEDTTEKRILNKLL